MGPFGPNNPRKDPGHVAGRVGGHAQSASKMRDGGRGLVLVRRIGRAPEGTGFNQHRMSTTPDRWHGFFSEMAMGRMMEEKSSEEQNSEE